MQNLVLRELNEGADRVKAEMLEIYGGGSLSESGSAPEPTAPKSGMVGPK